MTVLFNTLSST